MDENNNEVEVIQLSEGSDNYQNDKSNVSIEAGAGNDTINSNGDNVTIDGGAGNNFISNHKVNNFSVTAGNGNNTIWSNGSNNGTIVTGAGNDTFHFSLDDNINRNIYIDAGDGDNWLYLRAENATIKTGSGKDTISVGNGTKVTVDAGAGNDDIGAGPIANLTVSGGEGNDRFQSWGGAGKVYVYTSGNDTIQGFNALVIADPWTSQRTNDSTVVITVENKGTITLFDFYEPTKLNVVSSLAEVNYNYNVFLNKENAKQDNVTITGTEADDFVYNEGSSVSINTGGGNDVINNNADASNVTVDMGAGDDSICSWSGKSLSINGGTGNDTIFDWGEADNSTIIGGDGDDRIDNRGDSTSIDAGDGNDEVNTIADNVIINTGAGNDSIYNYYGNDVTIDGGDGNDVIKSWNADASGNSINGGAGDDYIDSHASESTLIGGTGDDTVTNYGAGQTSVLVDMGEGNDYVDSHASNTTIIGGDGNDGLYNHGNKSTVHGGTGDDTIENWYKEDDSENIVLDGGADNDNIANHGGTNVSINGGTGNDIIKNEFNARIEEGTGRWIPDVSPDNATLEGGAGNDSIMNEGKNASISGGDGDDTVNNNSKGYWDAVNQRSVILSPDNTKIEAGAGNDQISNDGFNATIDGGAGDDTIYNYEAGMVYVYRPGDGNDLICGFALLETLIVENAEYTTIKGDDDVFVCVGQDTITLSGAARFAHVNIVSLSENINPVNVIRNYEENVTIGGTSAPNWIRNFSNNVAINGGVNTDDIYNEGKNVTINSGTGNDQISNGDRGRYSTLIGGDGDDTITNLANDVTIDAGDGDDFIENVNDGDGNEDGSFGDGHNVSINAGEGNDIIENSGLNVTASGGEGNDLVINDGRGLAYVYSGGSDTIRNFHSSDTLVIKGGYSIQRNGDSVVVNVYDKGTITLENCTTSNIKVVSEVEDAQRVEVIRNYDNDTTVAGTETDDFIVSRGDNVSISAGTGDDNIEVKGTNVTVDGGTGNDFVRNWAENLAYVYTGGNDTIENFGNSSALVIKGDYSIQQNGNSAVVNVEGKGTITLRDCWADNIKIVSDISEAPRINLIFNDEDGKEIKGDELNDRIKNTGNRVTIKALGGNDRIWNGGGSFGESSVGIGGGSGLFAVIDAGDGNDYIENFGASAVINGGDGEDHIDNNGASALVNGGMSNDRIYNWEGGRYSTLNGGDGDDYIENFDEGVVINGGTSNDEILNWEGGRYSTLNGGAGDDTITNYGASAVVINGGAGDDYIDNGGASAVINGGTGNDYIVNSDGENVTFIHSGGNDTIDGFNETSKLFVGDGSANYTTRFRGADIIVGTDSGSVTLVQARYLSSVTVNDIEIETNSGIVNLSDDKDTYENKENEILINAGDGNDYIHNKGTNVLINGGGGDDTIENSGASAAISGGIGNDRIYNGNAGQYATLNGGGKGEGNNNYIENYANNVLINGGEGDDTIENVHDDDGNADGSFGDGDNVTINARGGNDSIENSGFDVRINTGRGNDTVRNEGINVTVEGDRDSEDHITNNGIALAYVYRGGGSATITNFRSKDTLVLNNGKYREYTLEQDGDNVIVRFERYEGEITLENCSINDVIDGVNVVRNIGDAQRVEIIRNYDSDTTVTGTETDDFIVSRGNNVSINAGTGDDSLKVQGTNVTVEGGEGNDFVRNWAENLAYVYTSGNDTIKNFGNSPALVIKGGYSIQQNGNSAVVVNVEGKGSITLRDCWADNIKIVSDISEAPRINLIFNDEDDKPIDGTELNDRIKNTGNRVTIKAFGGNDRIWNGGGSFGESSVGIGGSSGLFAVIDAGDGDDTIYNHESGSFTTINGGEGNDEIDNSGFNATLNGGAGDDTIYNNESGSSVTIDGGAGNDRIQNYGNNATIEGGSGNDYLYNEGANAVINGGAGDDSIRNAWDTATNSTIFGGEGNDSIYNNADNVVFVYEKGDGNDIIKGFDEDDTLKIYGTYSAATVGSDIILTVGTGSITLSDAATLTTLNIENDTNFIALTEGNDYYSNDSDNVTLAALGGDDTINNNGNNVTVSGGKGNDSIYSNGSGFAYVYSGGNDTIDNFKNALDYLVVNGEYSMTRDEEDYSTVYINVEGKGTITVHNAWGAENIHVVDSISKVPKLIKVIFNDESNVKITGSAGNDDLRNHDGSNVTIDAGNGNNFIYNSGANVSINAGDGSDTVDNDGTFSTIRTGAGDDNIQAGNNSTIDSGDGDDYILSGGNDNLIDAGAGDDFILSGGNGNLIHAGAGNDYIENHGNNVTVDGGEGNDVVTEGKFLTYVYSGGDDTIEHFRDNTYLVIADEYSMDYNEDGHLVISVEGKGSITLKDCWLDSSIVAKQHIYADVAEVPKFVSQGNEEDGKTVEGTDANDDIWNSGNNVTINGGGGKNYIENNGGANVDITTGADDDTIRNYDRYEWDEEQERDVLVSAADNTTINAGDGDDKIDNNGSNAVIINAGNGNNFIYNSGANVSINAGDGSDTVDNDGTFSTIRTGAGDDNIQAGNNSTIDSGDGDDYILSGGNDNLIDAGAGDDFILSGGNGNLIHAGDGDDYIENHGSNVTVSGGAGNDNVVNEGKFLTYVYSGGDDTIEHFRDHTYLVIADEYSMGHDEEGNQVIRVEGKGSITLWDCWLDSSIVAKQHIYADVEEVPKFVSQSNEEDGKTVEGTDDNDDIWNSGNNVTINAGDGKNYIENFGASVSINAGEGNDAIKNGQYGISSIGENSTILGGEGNDYIWNSADNAKLYGGDGDDELANDGGGDDDVNPNQTNYNVLLDGGDGNNNLWNNGDNATLIAGNGDDTVWNCGNKVSINFGAGNDSIVNYQGIGLTIDSGAGNDNVVNHRGDNSSINAGDGDNEIDNNGANVEINTGDGNDEIWNGGNSAVINAGDGDNKIDNDGANVEITTGDGNDEIWNGGDNAVISAGGGNNEIDNWGANVEITMGGGNDNIENRGNNVTIDGGTGNDNVINGGKILTYVYSGGNDTIEHFESHTYLVINGEYSIDSDEEDNLVISVEGKGTITLKDCWLDSSIIEKQHIFADIEEVPKFVSQKNEEDDRTVEGTDDNDDIWNSGNNVTINAGGGKNYIDNNGGANVEITTGADADTIRNGDRYEWDEEQERDVLVSAAANTTINAGGGDDYIGNDGNGAVINAGDGDDTVWNGADNVTISVGAGDDFVDNANAHTAVSIDAGIGNDTIWNHASNTTINAGAGNDTFHNMDSENVLMLGGDGYDTIYNHESGSSVTIDGGAGNDEIWNHGNSAVINGGDDNDSIFNSGRYAIIDAGAGNDSIRNEGYNATHSTIDGGAGDDSISGYFWSASISGGADDDLISIANNYNTIEGGTGNDQISLSADAQNNLIQYTASDGNDTINGFNSTSTLSISGGAYTRSTVGNDVIFNVGDGSITLIDAAGLSIINIIGTESVSNNLITLTEDNDTYSTTVEGATVQALGGNDSISNSYANVSINGGTGDDDVYNWGASAVVNGSTGNDDIYNWSDSAVVNGGAGNDKIYNWGDSAVVNDGSGNDHIVNEGENVTFIHSGGNDTIYGFNATSKLLVGNNYSVERELDKDNNETGNIIVNVEGKGSIKLTNWGFYSVEEVKARIFRSDDEEIYDEEKTIIELGDDDNEFNNEEGNVVINGGKGDDRIDNDGDNVTINGGAGDDGIYNWGASAVINGDDGDDYIHNHGDFSTVNGGAGNDDIYNWGDNAVINGDDGDDYIRNSGNSSTVSGGAGNDSIRGRYWNSSISSGDGDDIINITYAYSSTINAGAGDDYIDIRLDNGDVIEYAVGDGNDTINVNAIPSFEGRKLTLKLTDGELGETYMSDDGNIILKVGNNTLTFMGARGEQIVVVNANDEEIIVIGNRENLAPDEGTNNVYNAPNGGLIGYMIENKKADAKIYGSDADDGIRNRGASAVINGGEGNDYIENYGDNVTVSDFGGDDHIENYGDNVTINSDYRDESVDYFGNDDIYNEGVNVLIDAGAGNDDIDNNGKNVSINGGDGDDTIWNSGDNVTISGDAGYDYINNNGKNVLINGGDDDDDIDNNGKNVSINGGAGNDNIWNSDKYEWDEKQDKWVLVPSPDNTTIDAGSGDDEIDNNGKNVSINGGAGNDHIWNSERYEWDEKQDKWVLVSSPDNTTIDAGSGDDEIDNNGKNVLINGGDGNDHIWNSDKYEWDEKLRRGVFVSSPDNTTIDAGDGNDEIGNNGKNVLINGGDGDDTIWNSDRYEWDEDLQRDVLVSSPDNTTIDTGDGNDEIHNEGENVIINAGGGSNFIENNGGENVTFVYGGGNDTIEGFNESSTLRFDAGTKYSTNTDEDGNVIVTVGEDENIRTITLVNAAGLSNVNIESVEWKYDNKKATYWVNGEALITFTGVTSAEGLSVNGKTVTVGKESLDKAQVSISNGYTLALANGLETKEGEPEWTVTNGSGNNATATAKLYAVTTAGYKLANNKITYQDEKKTSTVLATVTGLKKDYPASALVVDSKAKTITVEKGALTTTAKVSLSGNGGYKFKLGEDVAPAKSETTLSVDNKGVATLGYTTTAGYELTNDTTLTYKSETTTTLAEVTGLNKNAVSEIEFDEYNKVIYLTSDALTDSPIKIIQGDYKLEINGIEESEIGDAEWKISNGIATYSRKIEKPGYTLSKDEKTLTYLPEGTEFEILAELKGISDKVTIDDLYKITDDEKGIITLSAEMFASNSVEVTAGNYKLAVDEDMLTEPKDTQVWNITKDNKGNVTATYADGKTDYYAVTNNDKKITYVKAKQTSDAPLFTLKGINGNLKVDSTGNIVGDEEGEIVTAITVDGTQVTLSDLALGEKDITITGKNSDGDNYTLALENIESYSVEQEEPVFKKSKTTATLNSVLTEGYDLSYTEQKLTYYQDEVNKVLATITGLKSSFDIDNDLDFDKENRIITVREGALTTNKKLNVGISSDGYKLALEESLEPNAREEWTTDSAKNGTTTAKFKEIADKGYRCNGTKITYSSKETVTTLAEVTGLKSGLKAVDGKIDGIDFVTNENEEVEVIQLGSEVLGTSNIAVTGNYKIKLDEFGGLIPASPEESEIWKFTPAKKNSDSFITLKAGTTGYYEEVEGNKQIDYHAAEQTGNEELAKITGLKDNLVVDMNGDIDGINIYEGVIYLKPDVLNRKTINLTGEGDYSLTLDTDEEKIFSTTEYKWTPSGTTAVLSSVTNAGYRYVYEDGNIKQINYYSESSPKLATLTGLKSGLKADKDGHIDGIEFITDEEGNPTNVIQLSKSVLGDNSVTLKNEKGQSYSLTLAEDVDTVEIDGKITWSRDNKGNVIAKANMTKGYACDGTTVTYKPKQNNVIVATITGLDKNFDISALTIEDGVITLPKDALTTSSISISSNYGYKLTLEDDIPQNKDDADFEQVWVIGKDKTSATLCNKTEAYYTPSEDGKSIAYTKSNADTTTPLATLTGLKKGTTADDISTPEESADGATIFLSENALGAMINLKTNEGYKLALENTDLEDDTQENVWSVSKTTATYKTITPAHYKVDDKTITYVKDNSGEAILTLSGLKNNLKVTDGEISGIDISEDNTITLSNSVLGNTDVTLAVKKPDDNYTLALNNKTSRNGGVKKSELEEAEWNYAIKDKVPTAMLRQKTTEGYRVDGNTVKYVKKSSTMVLAVVTGTIKDEDLEVPESDNDKKVDTVTLSSGYVNKKVTVSGSVAFDFEEDYSGSITGSKAADTISVAGDKANINAGAGNDSISITGADVTVIADAGNDTINVAGDSASVNAGAGNDSINVTGDSASVNAGKGNDSINVTGADVTVIADAGNDSINVTGDKASINAGAGNDTINVTETGIRVTINASTGNDTIDLGDNSVTFFYANGDGNDIIANFTADDEIQVTKCKILNVAKNDNNLVVSVGTVKKKKQTVTGKITLTDAANENYWFNDTNFGINDASVDELLAESADYSVGEIETSTGTNLTQEKTQLTFGKK